MFEKYFLKPGTATHRQYEALRACFVDRKPVGEVAEEFGYSPGTLRVMCSKFRKKPRRDFFKSSRPGPGKVAERHDFRDRIVELRKRNLSVYDIAEHLKADGRSLTAPAINKILREEGFARLPRRADEERPGGGKVEVAAVANVGELNLNPRKFHTKFGGLFLLLPIVAKLPVEQIASRAELPGTRMIPAEQALLSALALKLFGNARHTHVMSDVFDQGLGLFAGLNVIPKTSFLAQYSSRTSLENERLLFSAWFDEIGKIGYCHGRSFDLDFHTIPSHGDDELLERHYLSKRSRKQKGMLSFLANDTENRAFCYVNGSLRKSNMNNEIITFTEHWRTQTGQYPDELVFDSTFTTYENLDKLNKMGIKFITLRRRSSKILDQINAVPSARWKRVKLENVTREFRTPKILEEMVKLSSYEGEIRQIAVRDLGHEYPTVVLTNQLERGSAKLIQRYARRMIIENNIADAIDFFHMDALSSTVAFKVNFDLVLTVMASTVYRLFAAKIGEGYESAKFARIFRDFISATAGIEITEKEIMVKFQKRSHNPLLKASGILNEKVPISWLGNKTLNLVV